MILKRLLNIKMILNSKIACLFKISSFNPFRTNESISDRSLFMKISRSFEKSPTPYILSFFKIKYKHLFYKLERNYIHEFL